MSKEENDTYKTCRQTIKLPIKNAVETPQN